MLKATLIAILLKASVAVVVAQPSVLPAEGPGVGRNARIVTPYTALHSPEVHPDRTVTLRFHAPSATKVEVVGEILQGKGVKVQFRETEGSHVWRNYPNETAPMLFTNLRGGRPTS
jgi:hypothetical protein